jgi:uncharacterized protein YprB with RNaseH-like and TPR domain
MKARKLEIHRKKGPKSTLKSGALSQTCYLDIETTGLNRREDQISLIGIFHPSKGYVGLVGKFNKRNLLKELIDVKRIYTFNGKSFDMHWIKDKLGLDLQNNEMFDHIDLRYVCKRHGLTGGQKVIEHTIRLPRKSEIDGFKAAILGHRWLAHGDRKALKLLMEYNMEDVVNLWRLHKHIARL